MNIAFYTDLECCPEIGGTERTTFLVATALSKYYGHNIYSIYSQDVEDKKLERIKAKDYFRFFPEKNQEDDLVSFILDNNIDVIINQGSFKYGCLFSELRRKHHLFLTLIFALHFSPGSQEGIGTDYKYYYNIWIKNLNLKNVFKFLIYPFYSKYNQYKHQPAYRKITKEADKIVLLSDKYKNLWCRCTNTRHSDEELLKFISIPNALSFDYFASESDIKNKEKRILIVARLDERPKKLTKALKIWKVISHNPQMKDWQLDIVGDGPDAEMYRRIVKEQNIPRVNFYGRQDPQPFYRKSAIFMMTSAFEGFPMTLIEASQFGVVPIVFNTYLSLTDIITDGVNGFVIKPEDYYSYERRILELVEYNELRIKMAKNAVENSKRFTIDIIAEKWQSLIVNLSTNQFDKFSGIK